MQNGLERPSATSILNTRKMMLKTDPLSLVAPNFGTTHFENEVERGLAPPVLLQYWQVVLRWKWLIAGITIASLTLGLVATLLTTPQYTATSRIEISRAQKNVTSKFSNQQKRVAT
jgi:polysaccharide biosynthesis transport protein